MFKSLSGLPIILAQLLLLVKLTLEVLFASLSHLCGDTSTDSHLLPSSIPKGSRWFNLEGPHKNSTVSIPAHGPARLGLYGVPDILGTFGNNAPAAHQVGFLELYIHLHLLWLNLIWNAGLFGWKHCKALLAHQPSGEGNTWGVHNTFSQCQTAKIEAAQLQLKICTLLHINVDLRNAQQIQVIESFMSRKERIHGKTVKWSVENGCKSSRFPRTTRITSWRGQKKKNKQRKNIKNIITIPLSRLGKKLTLLYSLHELRQIRF